MMNLEAQEIADYLLAHQTSTKYPITPLKLQKLCYYAQGIALVVLERPLFCEDIEHWEHGPVVPELYKRYRSYRSRPIPPPEIDESLYDAETVRLLTKVNEFYGQYGALKLRAMTHRESPWKETTEYEVITHDALRQYFQSPTIYDKFATLTPDEVRELAREPDVTAVIRAGMRDRQAGRMVPLRDLMQELGA